MALSALLLALLVLAACASSAQARLSGTITSSYGGLSNSGFRGYYYTVLTNEGEKLLFVLDGLQNRYPDIREEASIVFHWDAECVRRGYADLDQIISVNGKSPR